MVIKRVYFINAIISLESITSVNAGQIIKGQAATIKYSEKLNSIIVNSTIIPLHQVREMIIEEEVEVKPEVKTVKTKPEVKAEAKA